MAKYSKRRVVIVSIFISLILWIALNLFLKTFVESRKKRVFFNSNMKTNKELQVENGTKGEDLEDKYTKAVNQNKQNNWRIIIPKINLDAPIIEGTTKEVLRKGVGHFRETSTWNGNVALAAHNRGYKYNYFQEIKKLKVGDIIEYQTDKGIRKYEVVENKMIKETDLSYLENTKENKITLITCVENLPEFRRCVFRISNKYLV